MSIQQDVMLESTGSVLELTGFTELGEEGDICNQLRKGERKKRYPHSPVTIPKCKWIQIPFCIFVTDTVQASELYSIFWKAVMYLTSYGFKVLFTCMDGAQANRNFMHICLANQLRKYITPSVCSSTPVIFIMDISHVLKKSETTLKAVFNKTVQDY
jgi:hypothetical protein